MERVVLLAGVAELLDAFEQESDCADEQDDNQDRGNQSEKGSLGCGGVRVGLGGCDGRCDDGPERQRDDERDAEQDEAHGDVLHRVDVGAFLAHRGEHRAPRSVGNDGDRCRLWNERQEHCLKHDEPLAHRVEEGVAAGGRAGVGCKRWAVHGATLIVDISRRLSYDLEHDHTF